jgi:hypothetical protein
MGPTWLRRSAYLLVILLTTIAAIGAGILGRHEGPGIIQGEAVPAAVLKARSEQQKQAREDLAISGDKNILFGDFHTHTTLSMDAFLMSMDLAIGEGTHPQADACDFARFCSALDFWSINDHAEFLTPQRWRETIASIRECNARAEDPLSPDTVAFLGWEWTNIGTNTENHWGHKNVVIRGLEDDEIPVRAIQSGPTRATDLLDTLNFAKRTAMSLIYLGDQRVQDFAQYLFESKMTRPCPEGFHVAELPSDCTESAPDPKTLFSKLRQWGHDMMVIPHGNSWGIYTPAGSSWDKQLVKGQHDAKLQTMIEVYSGHGNIEEYRDWRGVVFDESGNAQCPAPSSGYTPVCWRAGEIIRKRCLASGKAQQECEQRAAFARTNLIAAPQFQAEATIPMATEQDWLDAGQCRDCFQPPWYHRPANSAQYALAMTNFDDKESPRRFRFGFLGSSDVHSARPGTGYKEYDRFYMADFQLPIEQKPIADADKLPSEAIPFPDIPEPSMISDDGLVDDRLGAFYQTGGLIAAHSRGRSRDQIWSSLQRKEVYATSGQRTLLWFDLVNPPGGVGSLPMGSEVGMGYTPRFRAQAVGSFKQQPGCPEYATRGLTPTRLDSLCRGECFNPSEERKLITRIEVVRIRPQSYANEPIGELIEDPWKVFQCDGEPTGCAVEFSDPDFNTGRRDAVYYVRAIEEPSDAVNGAQLDCEYDENNNCSSIRPRPENPEDDRLAPIEERAWSSPIFVDYLSSESTPPPVGDI